MPVDPVDKITLNGTDLLCDGVQAGKSVSEFTSGLKIGRANYDDRQHAFYTVLDDFSGGFGYRQLDIREALGTHWDNQGGADLRRARHITLPPKRYVVSPDSEPGFMTLSSEILDGAAVNVPTEDPTNSITDYFYYGAGDSVFRVGQDRDSLERVQQMTYHAADGPVKSAAANTPTKMTRLFMFRGALNVRRLYLITANENAAGSSSRYLYTTDPGAATPTWTEGTKAIWDAIAAPVGEGGANIIVAQEISMKFMFATDPTTGGTDWNIDDADAAINPPIWIPRSICHFLGVAALPDRAEPGIYFIDYGDGFLYALDFNIRKAKQIPIGDYHYLVNGVVWHGNVVVTDGWDIWIYTPGGGGAETVRKIGLWGKDGVPDSLRAGRYRITGLIDGGDQLFAIAERTALAKAAATATLGFVIFVYNGAGWSQYIEKQEIAATSTSIAVNPITAVIDRYPSGVHAAANMQLETQRALNVLCQMHPDSAVKIRLHSMRWPQIGSIPIDGTDEFDTSQNGFLTGWIDGGFRDVQGTLYYIKVDLQEALAGSAVEVAYRLDDDESGGFTVLGTASVRGTPAANIFQFDETGNEAGKEFRTVQFRVRVIRDEATLLDGAMDAVVTGGTYNVDSTTGWPSTGMLEIGSEVLYYSAITGAPTPSFTVPNTTPSSRGMRGTDVATHTDNFKVYVLTRTPELRAITLAYSKKSKLRKTWVVQVDVDKMVEQKTQVDTNDSGSPDANATHQNVWDFLETIWDKQTLVKLIVPEMEPTADNVRVQIADMVYVQDDARSTSTARGRINLTLIQPVNA